MPSKCLAFGYATLMLATLALRSSSVAFHFVINQNFNVVMEQQTMKPGIETGSFINMMMSRNRSLPEVGKGATLLSWTDRHAYEVMSVSPDGKRVVIQQYIPERIDQNGMSMSECQDYKYEKLNGHNEVVVWRNGAWRSEVIRVEFCKDYYAEFERRQALCETSEQHDALYEEMIKPLLSENSNFRLVDGKTCLKKQYSKVNVLWGVKDEYYDYTF